MRSSIPFLLMAAIFAGCASAGGGSSSGESAVITAGEIQEAGLSGSAYDAVERLRPRWLRLRGRQSVRTEGSTGVSGEPIDVFQSEGVAAMVDGVRFSDAAMLRDVAAQDVYEIRFLNSRDATTRYGTGYPHGVILVTTRRN